MAGREQAESLSAVFARNARTLRTGAGLRTEEVAKAVSARGLHWVTSRVSELEMGRIAPTLSTLLVLSATFTDLLDEPITLADWFAGDEQVELTESVRVPLAVVRAALSGVPVSLPEPSVSMAQVQMQEYLAQRKNPNPISPGRLRKLAVIWDHFGGAEDRAARTLGVDRGTLCELMLDLWGTTLSTKRDQLAGPGANAQKRGRIARELKEQLREAIADGKHRKIRDI